MEPLLSFTDEVTDRRTERQKEKKPFGARTLKNS